MPFEEEYRLVLSKSGTTLLKTGTMPYTDGNNQTESAPQSPSPYLEPAPPPGGQRLSTQSHESETGELIDNDDLAFSQFHADAIKQAGFGKYQLMVTLITGLGLAGHTIQIYSVFYITPSAEVEYCIVDKEKSWLASITLLGMGIGGIICGGMSGRTGRRKTLLSCLALSGVFSVIAAFMPTYGPFMMARFCAAFGIGGALPAAAAYIAEITPPTFRVRMLGLLGALCITGGLIAAWLATETVPMTGQLVIEEDEEHFSAWHQYLLYCCLPTFASLFGLLFYSESPRYLLENNREVEALGVYQAIYQSNRSKGNYSLTELELPGTRYRQPSGHSVLLGMMLSCQMVNDLIFVPTDKRIKSNHFLFFFSFFKVF